MACAAACILVDYLSFNHISTITARGFSRSMNCFLAGSFVIQLLRDKVKTRSRGHSGEATAVYMTGRKPQGGKYRFLLEAPAMVKYASKEPGATSSEP